MTARPLRVAIAGNPNSGKSTLVNAIAGTRLRVGNWPGVTIEKAEARIERGGRVLHLIDLPGTYSLSPFSPEELVARDHLVRERPDVIVDVVDATNLERNLYLTVQLLELGIPVVVALNIHDEAVAKGYRIDATLLETRLGVPVVATSATRRTGLDALLDTILRAAEGRTRTRTAPLSYGRGVDAAVAEITASIRKEFALVAPALPVHWLGLKVLEGDVNVVSRLGVDRGQESGAAVRALAGERSGDVEAILAETRHEVAAGLTREAVARTPPGSRDLTERIDGFALHRVAGIPIFLAAMWLVFKLTFELSEPFGDWIRATTDGPLKRWVEVLLATVGAPPWTVSLVNDGILSGVGFVLVFVPVIFSMMFFITFLEGSGYMARAAFVMDRALSLVGLHGKSFIPMLLGFGCNVPGVYATRALESERDRLLTALLVPLMSCGARLPVYVLFVGAFFPAHAGTVVWSLYMVGIALALGLGVILDRTLIRGVPPVFLLELPPYRMPSLPTVLAHAWEKTKHFLVKAGTYVLAVSVLVWFLLNLPWGVQDRRDSYLGQAGQVVAPVLAPLGFGSWEAASSLITGVIAKEIVVGTMAEIYAPTAPPRIDPSRTLAEDLRGVATSLAGAARRALVNVGSTAGIWRRSIERPETRPGIGAAIQRSFTPLSACSFMIFVLLYTPCIVVGVALRQEFGTWKWFALATLYQTALAWCAAFAVFQGGRLLGLGG